MLRKEAWNLSGKELVLSTLGTANIYVSTLQHS